MAQDSQPVPALTPAAEPAPVCVILDKLAEAEELLQDVTTRVWQDKSKDPPKEIALALLDPACTLRVIKIVKRKKELVVPAEFAEYRVDIVPRFNRLWNSYATHFRVTSPEGMTVLRIKYPIVEHSSKVNRMITVAYNPDLRLPEILDQGHRHLDMIIDRAYSELRADNVYSLALAGTPITGVTALKPRMFKSLPLLEQSDPGECFQDCVRTTDMILIRLGADQLKAFTLTVSKAKAYGLMQYTKGTYDMMRRAYPGAHLDPNFVTGTTDHVNAMKAAIVLYDYNLSRLVEHYGPAIVHETTVPEWLAAAYNGGVEPVIATNDAAIRQQLDDWTSVKPIYAKRFNRKKRRKMLMRITIFPETVAYIKKLRELEQGNLIDGIAKDQEPAS